MARLSYPAPGEPRPAALPPERRTVGQLVAESINAYGERFLPSLALGIGPALIAVVTVHVSHAVWLILAPTVVAAILSISFTGAAVLVLKRRPPWRRLAVAWGCGWLVLAPLPFLVLAFVLPGLAWLAAVGLVVPVLVVEDLAPRAAPGPRVAARARRLRARARVAGHARDRRLPDAGGARVPAPRRRRRRRLGGVCAREHGRVAAPLPRYGAAVRGSARPA